MQIAVVDLGVGNLRSVSQALQNVAPDADVVISSNVQVLAAADKLVLPGQGAVGSWFAALDQRGLRDVLEQALQEKPLLGICVGMQALFSWCEEDGGLMGLDIFSGTVRHFSHFHPARELQDPVLKIPQMGWNQIRQQHDHPLWQNIARDAWMYFLHSYCANMSGPEYATQIAATADYGHEYVAAVCKNNVFATQFHPEKSAADGLQLLRNFSQWNGRV